MEPRSTWEEEEREAGRDWEFEYFEALEAHHTMMEDPQTGSGFELANYRHSLSDVVDDICF